MEHQDWKVYINHCKPSAQQKDNNTTKVIKQKHKENVSRVHKIESMEKEDNLKHKKIDPEFKTRVQQSRLKMNLTQKDLAKRLSIPVSKINDIETGKAIYEPQINNKLKRFFKI
jgi:ribosome-binding protein aMBF1 (putative translation factor)